jgi:cysteinyl-tRNA synthetase
MDAVEDLSNLPDSGNSTVDVSGLKEKTFAALSDDLNSPVAIASLFDGVKIINSVKNGTDHLSKQDIEDLKLFFHTVIFDILGLVDEKDKDGAKDEVLNKVVELLLNLRVEAKSRKDWHTADSIRDGLNSLGIEVKDTKEGFEWKFKKIDS